MYRKGWIYLGPGCYKRKRNADAGGLPDQRRLPIYGDQPKQPEVSPSKGRDDGS